MMIDKEFIAVFHYDDGGSNRCGAEPYRYAEEIVRCRECNEADSSGMPKGRYYCMNHACYMYANDFCSYGVRKGADDE